MIVWKQYIELYEVLEKSIINLYLSILGIFSNSCKELNFDMFKELDVQGIRF